MKIMVAAVLSSPLACGFAGDDKLLPPYPGSTETRNETVATRLSRSRWDRRRTAS